MVSTAQPVKVGWAWNADRGRSTQLGPRRAVLSSYRAPDLPPHLFNMTRPRSCGCARVSSAMLAATHYHAFELCQKEYTV